MPLKIFTIGYEKATQAELIDALHAAGVERLIDVRAVPLSRRPGFSKNILAGGLAEAGIDYVHLKALGTPPEGREAARKNRHADLERIYAWERRLYGDALHVFAQGSPHADSVVDFYGVPCERTSVVGGGANFVPLPELSHREREPVLLFVGRDWHRKGGDRLIEAWRRVREQVPEARLQIVGTDEAPRGEPGVEVLGVVRGRDKMAALYESAQAFCLPSRYDPYGLAIAEGMAYGLPWPKLARSPAASVPKPSATAPRMSRHMAWASSVVAVLPVPMAQMGS